jgi:hypothetical protein
MYAIYAPLSPARLAPRAFARQEESGTLLLGHVVGGHLQRQWNRDAERLGGFQIDHEIEFGGL